MLEIFKYIVIIAVVAYLLKLAFGLLFMYLFDNPQKRGEDYEERTAGRLKHAFNVPVYRNLLFNKYNEEEASKQGLTIEEHEALMAAETEADMVFVNRKGIFCIECKSRKDGSDVMTGNLNQSIWNVSFDQLQNPFDQNYKHVKAIYEAGITDKSCVYNIVITNAGFKFVYCGLDKDSSKEPYFGMLRNKSEMMALVSDGHGRNGIRFFEKDVDNLPDILTDSEVESIREALKSHVATKKERKRHARLMEETH